jgi:signal transduction histidine kinase
MSRFGEANRRKQLRLNETILALTTEGRERKRAEDQLRKAHDELEQRVVERTAELSQALARLESEIRVSEKKEEQLRNLSLRLMTLQDEERRRIARELHDSAGQTLAAMKLSIALIRRSDTASPAFSRLSSRACGPRNHMKISQSQAIIHDGSERRDRSNRGEAETERLSDPERA